MLRPLGRGEKFIWLIDRASSFNFIIHARVNGGLAPAVLEKALAAVQARHPLLRARIAQVGWTGAVFREDLVPAIPLRLVEDPGADWNKEAERELQSNFNTDAGPLARCTLVKESSDSAVIIMAFHHAIGDALSGIYLLRDLLQAAELAASGRSPALPRLGTPPSMDKGLPQSVRGLRGAWGYLSFMSRLFTWFVKNGKPHIPKPDQKSAVGERRVQMINREMAPEVVKALLQKARSEKTTLHGAISAAHALAMAELAGMNRPAACLIASDINMRPRLSPQIGEDVGFYISGCLNLEHAGPGSNFWELARSIRNQLGQLLENGQPFHLFKSITLAEAMFRPLGTGGFAAWACANYVAAANPGMFAVSNIGKVEIPSDYGRFHLENFGFASSFSTTTDFCLHCATFNGRLVCNFGVMGPVYSRAIAEKLADRTRRILAESV